MKTLDCNDALYPALKVSESGQFVLSLEDYVSCERYMRDEQIKFTVNRCPELVCSTVNYLRNKDDALRSKAAVTRYLTAYGVQVIQRIPSIKDIKAKKRSAYECGTERDRLMMSENVYDFSRRISIAYKRMTVYAPRTFGAAMDELATDIGTSVETVVKMSLIAAISFSDRWVPEHHRKLMSEEFFRFIEWVEELAGPYIV